LRKRGCNDNFKIIVTAIRFYMLALTDKEECFTVYNLLQMEHFA
jgi:hypothetical protein